MHRHRDFKITKYVLKFSSLLFVIYVQLLNLNAYAGGALKPWEKDCVDLEKTQANSCDHSQPALQHIQNLHLDMLKSTAGQNYLEHEFLWNFLDDQAKQTQCEKTLLAPYDLTPNDGTACGDSDGRVDPKTSIAISLCKANPDAAGCSQYFRRVKVSTEAQIRQYAIVDQVWRAHKLLVQVSDACAAAAKKLEFKTARNTVVSGVMTTLGVNSMIGVDLQGEAALEKDQAFHCSEKATLVSEIWNGASPEMQTFLNAWVDKFRKNPSMTKEQFSSTAVPIAGDHTFGEARDDLTLESVVWKMSCKAQRRDSAIKSAMEFKDGKWVPKPDANDPKTALGRKVFDALLGDGGQAANAYLQRSVYAGVSSALYCHLLSEYNYEWDHTRTYKVIKTGVELGGTVAVMMIPGVDVAVASTVMGASIATFNSYMACKGAIKPGDLQVSPVCDLIKGHEKDANFVTSKVESAQGCLSSIESGALSTLASALGGAEKAEANAIKSFVESDQAAELAALKEGAASKNLVERMPAALHENSAIERPPVGMSFNPAGEMYSGNQVSLMRITPEQFEELPKGTVIYDVTGKKFTVGVNTIDLAVHDGFLRFGFKPSQVVGGVNTITGRLEAADTH